jgi:hypothetical protein
MTPSVWQQGASALAVLLVAATVWNLVPTAGNPDRSRATGSGSGPGRTRSGPDRPQGSPQEVPASIVLEMVAAALDCGASPSRATATVSVCLRDTPGPLPEALGRLSRHLASGAGLADLRDGPAALVPLLDALDLALTAGIGPAPLVRSAAREHRRRRVDIGVLAARRLGVTVLLPTGLCLLPAFVLLTVAPLVLALLGNGA